MSRQSRTQRILDDAEALIAWAGLLAFAVALAGYPQALLVTAVAVVLQAVRGHIR